MPNIATWSRPGTAFSVEYSREALEQVRRHALLGFLSVPKIGAGVGGLLLGERTADGIQILDSVEIPCSYASGPSFALTDAELAAALALARASRELSVVGWYVSRMRGAIEMGERELGLYDVLCPEPWQVALVVQPSAVHTTRAVLCGRDGSGRVVNGAKCDVEAWAPDEDDLSDLEEQPAAAPAVAEAVAPPPAVVPAPAEAAVAAPPPPEPPASVPPPTPAPPPKPVPPPKEEALPAFAEPPAAQEAPRSRPPVSRRPAGGTRVDQLKFAQGPDIPDFEYSRPSTTGVLPIRPRFAKEPVAPAGMEVHQSAAADPRAPGVIPIRPKFDKSPPPAERWAGPPPSQPKSRRFWGLLGAAAALLLLLALYLVKDSWIPHVPLKLDMTESGGQVAVIWNKEAVAGVEQASLILNDGGQLESVLLSAKQLAGGQYLYKRKSDRVTAIIRSGDERVFAVWEAAAKPQIESGTVQQAVQGADSSAQSTPVVPVVPGAVPAIPAPAQPVPAVAPKKP